MRRAHPPHRPLRPPALSLGSQPPPPFTPRSRRLIEEPGRIGRSPGARSAGVSCRGRAEVLGGRATGVSARGLARVRASAARALPVARPPSSTVQAAPETSTWAGWEGQGASHPFPPAGSDRRPEVRAHPQGIARLPGGLLCSRALQAPWERTTLYPGTAHHALLRKKDTSSAGPKGPCRAYQRAPGLALARAPLVGRGLEAPARGSPRCGC